MLSPVTDANEGFGSSQFQIEQVAKAFQVPHRLIQGLLLKPVSNSSGQGYWVMENNNFFVKKMAGISIQNYEVF